MSKTISKLTANSFLGRALCFSLGIITTHAMDQKQLMFKRVTRQHGLVALDNVRELHLNIEQTKSTLPDGIVRHLQEAVGSCNIAQVHTIMRNLIACPFPFTCKTQTLENSQVALEKLVTVILSLRVKNVELASEVFYKILALCPELIHDQRLFTQVLPNAIETNCLDIFIPQFPLLWFTKYTLEKKETKSRSSHVQKISESAAITRLNEILAVLPISVRTRFDENTQAALLGTLSKHFNRLLSSRHNSI